MYVETLQGQKGCLSGECLQAHVQDVACLLGGWQARPGLPELPQLLILPLYLQLSSLEYA